MVEIKYCLYCYKLRTEAEKKMWWRICFKCFAINYKIDERTLRLQCKRWFGKTI